MLMWFYAIYKFCTKRSFGLLLCFFLICFTGFAILFGYYLFPIIRKIYTLIYNQIYYVNIFDDGFRNVSLSIGGSITLSIAVLGIILTLIRSTLNRQQNNTDVQKIVAEQISRAIDQIGGYKQNNDGSSHEPNIEARVGGIYSLERIAQDSARDYKKIMDILCAYVRATALKESKLLSLRTANTREDIQAAIDVLGTKKSLWLFWKRDKFRVNLENCDLSGYRFSELNFNTYNINGGAIFDKSWFKDAVFFETDLSYASFDEAKLDRADFEDAKLIGARFLGTTFKDTKVHGADFSKADDLTQDQVNNMLGNPKTKLPDGIKRPKSWLTP